MEQEDTGSFWADIKKYEDILARDPASYSFSHLADLYRKIGLLDDAIALSEKGIEMHPDYVGGYMALGRACYEKGLKERSREALERVVRVTPENISAQKILSHIYAEMDEPALAEQALRTILSMNPTDEESRLSLETITRASATRGEQADVSPATTDAEPDEVELLDDAELLLDADVMEDLEEAGEEPAVEPASAPSEEPIVMMAAPDPLGSDSIDIISGRDPLTTVTLAEIYVSQGFLKRALTIYRDLLHADPENENLRKRLFDLKLQIDEDNERARNDGADEEPFDETAEEESLAVEQNAQVLQATFDTEPVLSATPAAVVAAPAQVAADPVETLEVWLENIQRRRSCH